MLQDLVNATTLGSIYLLFALGMALAWGTIGILNFAHGAIFMFSSFTAYLVSQQARLPLVAVVGIAVVTGALLSTLAQLFAFQPIMRRAKDHRAAELQILIGGIGVAAIPLAIAQKLTKSNPFGFTNSSYKAQVYTVAGLRLSNTMLIIILAGLGLGLGAAWWIKTSRRGLALRAIGVEAETASLMGVNRGSLAISTMAVAGALAGLAGALLTYHLSAIAPESGDALLVKAFAAIVLGGLGSVAGVVAGCYILAITETIILTQTSGTWVDAVSFGLIFIVLLLRPQGLFGRREVRRT